jgi:putative cofactor-binding repeat protein
MKQFVWLARTVVVVLNIGTLMGLLFSLTLLPPAVEGRASADLRLVEAVTEAGGAGERCVEAFSWQRVSPAGTDVSKPGKRLFPKQQAPRKRAVYTVCPAGPPTCNFSIVQDAVDAADSGDVIKVASAAYTDVHAHGTLTQVVYLSKTITIRGGYDDSFTDPPDPIARPTILDAGGQGRVFYVIGNGIAPMFEGIWLTGGDTTALPGQVYGGGVYASAVSLTISGCHIISNTAGYGGGIYLYDSDAVLTANYFSGNHGQYIGGGLLTGGGATTLTANIFTSNFAGTGGGLYIGSYEAALIDNSILTNTAQFDGGGAIVEVYGGKGVLSGNLIRANAAGWQGGGLYFGEPVLGWAQPPERRQPSPQSGSSILVNGNDIISNSAQMDAGGVFMGGDGGTPLLEGNTIRYNSAQRHGGGIYLDWSSEHAVVSGNIILSNSALSDGGGIYLGNEVVVVQDNVVQANSAVGNGGGIYGVGAMIGNQVVENTAALHGGGIWGGGTLNRNVVLSNTAAAGGGLYLDGAVLTNTIIADNQVTGGGGGGLFITGTSCYCFHTTLARNHGGDGSGVYVSSGSVDHQVFLTNTILVSHSIGIQVMTDSTATLEGTLWGAGRWANGLDWVGPGTVFTGTVNLWGDPAFVSSDNGDYHITLASAALDAGVDSAVSEDMDGESRPAGPGYDIGADELWADYSVYLPLILRGFP